MGRATHVEFVECGVRQFSDGRPNQPMILRQTCGGTGYIPLYKVYVACTGPETTSSSSGDTAVNTPVFLDSAPLRLL